LLLLKEKAYSVSNSIGILRSRRKALIREFLDTSRPFLKSREEIRKIYGKALDELALSIGHEGRESIESIAVSTERDLGVEIVEKSIWGLRYKDITVHESPVRSPDERGYDYLSTTPHLEECIYLFERLVESMLEIASFESKLKRLGDEILRTTRQIRVLEDRVLPDLNSQMKSITQYIGEREREGYYRLKRFKGMRLG